MKRISEPRLRVWLGLIFTFLFVGCTVTGREAPTPTPIPQIVAVDHTIFTVQRGPIRSAREVYGEIVPARQADLFFHASGFVARVMVKLGDPVKQGDLLAELQVEDLLAELEQAALDLAVAQNEAENQKLQQAYEVQRAASEVAILEIQVGQARRRAEELWGNQKEDAQVDLAILEERLGIARAYLELVRGRKDKDAQPAVERNRLAVARLESLLAERQIVAPYDGIVLNSYVEPGGNIDAFSTAIILGDPQSLVIRIAYDQTLADILEPGTKAFMSLTRSMDQKYPVQFLPDFLPVTNAKSALKIHGDAPQLNYLYFTTPTELDPEQLPLGGGVTLEVVLGEKENALLLSPAAIRGNEDFKYVIVLEGDTHRRVELLNIGLKGDQMWEVIANLEEGDQILAP